MEKNKTTSQASEIHHISSFTLSTKERYLGISLNKHCSSLIQNNYIRPMNQIKADLKTWGKLQLSLLG